MDRDALAYLDAHLNHFEAIKYDLSSSGLVAVPKDSKIESLESFQDAPNRIERQPSLSSCESFCDYVNRFKDETSSVYLDVRNGKFEAVLDHHESDKPSWSKHRARFVPCESLSWKAWSGIHKTKLNQIQLAEFIEENLDSISNPEPNVMLKAALDFQLNEAMVYSSKKSLDDGSSRLLFEKNNVTKEVIFPHRITLTMSVHERERLETFKCRIRFTVDGNGALVFTFSFIEDPEAIVQAALEKIGNNIIKQTDGLNQYHGTF